jgi:hypothetical protein
VAQEVGPEIKTQYHKKKKKAIQTLWKRMEKTTIIIPEVTGVTS